MKKLSSIYILGILALLMALVSCGDDDENWRNDPPKIAFSIAESDFAEIDLDESTGPRVTGTVQSDAGLTYVKIETLTTGGAETIEEVSAFDEVTSKILILDFLPAYSTAMTGVKVYAEDVQGRTIEKEISLSAIGGLQGPKIEIDPDSETLSANVRPTVNIRPKLAGSIATHWGLKSITYSFLSASGEEQSEVITEFGTGSKNYTLNYEPDYDRGYELSATGLRIVAIDTRNNESIDTVALNIVDAAEAPAVTFDQERLDADLKSVPNVKPNVSGSIYAEEGFTSIEFFLVKGNNDIAVSNPNLVTVDANNSTFDFVPEYEFGISALKVKAVDGVGQITIATIPITVNADDPDLYVTNDITLYGAGERFSQNSAYSFETNTSYVYDQDPTTDASVASTIFFVASAPSNSEASYDVFAPTDSWLDNNYFKTVTWAAEAVTELRLLEVGEVDFENLTSIDIESLEMGETVTRARRIQDGSKMVLFKSGSFKGIIYLLSSTENTGSHKNDAMKFRIKYIKN